MSCNRSRQMKQSICTSFMTAVMEEKLLTCLAPTSADIVLSCEGPPVPRHHPTGPTSTARGPEQKQWAQRGLSPGLHGVAFPCGVWLKMPRDCDDATSGMRPGRFGPAVTPHLRSASWIQDEVCEPKCVCVCVSVQTLLCQDMCVLNGGLCRRITAASFVQQLTNRGGGSVYFVRF